MSRRPDPARELRALLRAPENGEYNLAAFIAERGAELGLSPNEMKEPDDVLAPRLRAALEVRRLELRRAVDENLAAVLRQLQSAARWRGETVLLPPAPLFRLASLAVGKKYIRFVAAGADITVPRQLLQRAGTALRPFRHVSVLFDRDGVHLTWRRGRGRLNFYSQQLKEPADALIVTLPRRTVTQNLPTLLGDIIAELGFGT